MKLLTSVLLLSLTACGQISIGPGIKVGAGVSAPATDTGVSGAVYEAGFEACTTAEGFDYFEATDANCPSLAMAATSKRAAIYDRDTSVKYAGNSSGSIAYNLAGMNGVAVTVGQQACGGACSGDATGNRTYHVKVLIGLSSSYRSAVPGTYNATLAVNSGNVLTVTSPGSQTDSNWYESSTEQADNYTVCISSTGSGGTYYLQSTGLDVSTASNWTMPDSGIDTGSGTCASVGSWQGANAHNDQNSSFVKSITGTHPNGLTHFVVAVALRRDTPTQGGAKNQQAKFIYLKSEVGGCSGNDCWHFVWTSDGDAADNTMGIYSKYNNDCVSTTCPGYTLNIYGSQTDQGNRPSVYNGIYELPRDTFSCLVWEIQVNDASTNNGYEKMYIDGVMQSSKTNFQMRAPAYTKGITQVEVGRQIDRVTAEPMHEKGYIDNWRIIDMTTRTKAAFPTCELGQ